MFNHLGPLEVQCDAPPLAVVEACAGAGLASPLDVRWCQIAHLADELERGTLLDRGPWRWFFGKGRPRELTCFCGRALPPLQPFAFTVLPHGIVEYRLGQCGRCRTIFWDEG